MSRKPTGESGISPEARPRRGSGRARRPAALLLIGVAMIAALVWVNLYGVEHDLAREAVRRFGYPGLFVAAVASGFNLVVPVPIIGFFPFFLAAGLAPVPTVAVIAAGMTLGDLIGYVLGRGVREMVPPSVTLVARLEALRQRHPRLPLLAMFLYAAFAPAPNEVLVVPLAFMRYPWKGIFAAVLAGNLIFNSLVAAGVVTVFGLI